MFNFDSDNKGKFLLEWIKNNSVRLTIIVPLVILTVFILFTASTYSQYQTKFYSEIYIAGIDLHGKDYDNAKAKLEEKIVELQDRTIELSYRDDSEKYPISEFDINWKLEESLEQAKQYDELSIIELIRTRFTGITPTSEMELQKDYAANIPDEIISEWKDKINAEPVDAELEIDDQDQDVQIEPHEYGKEFNKEALINDIELVIAEISCDLLPFLESETLTTIEITADIVSPEVVKRDLQKLNVDTLVSSYQTEYDPEEEGRTTNIELAADEFDGYLVKPDEELRFNDVVGPRTEDQGYQEAPVLIQGEYVDGLGGGICQVSSTLYNAALKAGMDVVQRSPHGRPVSYVPLGRDATVAYDYLDLIMENTSDDALLLSTVTGDGNLTIDIYGSEDMTKLDYKFVSENYEEIPPETEYYWKNEQEELRELSEREIEEMVDENGEITDQYKEELEIEQLEEGRVGYRIEVYLVKAKQEEELARELLSEDTYTSSPEKFVITE